MTNINLIELIANNQSNVHKNMVKLILANSMNNSCKKLVKNPCKSLWLSKNVRNKFPIFL